MGGWANSTERGDAGLLERDERNAEGLLNMLEGPSGSIHEQSPHPGYQ